MRAKYVCFERIGPYTKVLGNFSGKICEKRFHEKGNLMDGKPVKYITLLIEVP